MSILHTVNKSPFETGDLSSCMAHVNSGDAVLLFEDGVYGALEGTSAASEIDKPGIEVFVLGPDLAARGIAQGKITSKVKVIGYDDFVDLATSHNAVNSWL